MTPADLNSEIMTALRKILPSDVHIERVDFQHRSLDVVTSASALFADAMMLDAIVNGLDWDTNIIRYTFDVESSPRLNPTTTTYKFRIVDSVI